MSAISPTTENSVTHEMRVRQDSKGGKDLTPLKNKNALVVDNALATRRALQDQLSQLGARSVVFAGTVAEVEQHLLTRDFSLIVCEYQLEGERNGQQLLEDLRVNRKLMPHTAFMMVTGERTYSNVVSVAEFEPDDYLIKPFTASILSERVIKIFTKKTRLEPVYKAMYDGRFSDAARNCVDLSEVYPQHTQELLRLRIEAYIRSEDFDTAEHILKDEIEKDLKPWMNLMLAKIKSERKSFSEASQLLSSVVKSNPEYMAAYDLFADVLWEQNKPNEALDVLERMGAKALGSTTRLRKLADLSVRIGDNTRSKNYLNKVIDRARNSSLSQIHDYLQLAKIYVTEGKHEEAERLTAKLRGSVNSDELEMARSMMSIQKFIADGRNDKAIEKLNSFFAENSENMDDMAAETLTSLLELCFSVNMQGKGYELARSISKKKPSKAMLDRIRISIDTFKTNNAKTQENET